MVKRVLCTVFPLFLATVAALPVHAGLLYTTGFESPTFTPGTIAGQDGWGVFGPGLVTVEGAFAESGAQAVFIDGASTGQTGPFHSDSSTGKVQLSADIAIFTSSTQSEWQF